MTDMQTIAEFSKKLEEATLSHNTIRAYKKKLEELNTYYDKPVEEITLDEFKEFHKDKNPHTTVQYINALNKYKSMNGLDHNDWIEYRKNELDKQTQKHTKKCNSYLKDLPTREQMIEHGEKMYKLGDLQGYIMNYLLVNFYCRNQDLECKIITKKDELNKSDNFLYIQRGKPIKYIRNNYKTKFSYDTKEHDIDDPVFCKRLKQFNKNFNCLIDPETPTSSKQTLIKSKTLNKLGEVMYLKSQIYHLKDPTELNNISDRRGTNLKLLLNDYNPNALPVPDE